MAIPVRITQRTRVKNIPKQRNLSNLIPISQTSLPSCDKTRLTYMNVGSVKNKANSIYDYIVESNVDLMALTETWLYVNVEENVVHINELIPSSYKILHSPRSDGRVGGGVALIFRDSFRAVKVKKNRTYSKSRQFEHLVCVISLNKDQRSNVRLAVVYRPQPTKVNKLSVK